MTTQETNMPFWEHLDVLRTSLIRIVAVSVLCGAVAFLFKEEVFSVVLAPKDSESRMQRQIENEVFRFGYAETHPIFLNEELIMKNWKTVLTAQSKSLLLRGELGSRFLKRA